MSEFNLKGFLGNLMILFGCLCIMMAGAISYRNYELDQHGEEFCADVATQFQQLVQMEPLPDVGYLYEYELDFPEEEVEPEEEPDGLFGLAQFIEPEEELPVYNEAININGDLYIGLLSIPQLGLNLPIHMTLTLNKLDTAPCVYLGNLSENDLIIAGHNYKAHFWYLSRLAVGAVVTITDPNGIVYTYKLSEKSTISQYAVEYVENRDSWDLTIFTCDYPNNNNRQLYRFVRVY